MIRLTRIDYDGNKKPIIIDAESIESIEDGEKRTELTTKRGWTFYVVESREEVARKVLEWRLAMIDYHHDIPSVKTKAMAELANLAGLEIPKGEETA